MQSSRNFDAKSRANEKQCENEFLMIHSFSSRSKKIFFFSFLSIGSGVADESRRAPMWRNQALVTLSTSRSVEVIMRVSINLLDGYAHLVYSRIGLCFGRFLVCVCVFGSNDLI